MEPKAAAAPSPNGDGKHAPATPPAAITSVDLLRGGKMVEIRHNGEVYRLQTTRLGKLILTK